MSRARRRRTWADAKAEAAEAMAAEGDALIVDADEFSDDGDGSEATRPSASSVRSAPSQYRPRSGGVPSPAQQQQQQHHVAPGDRILVTRRSGGRRAAGDAAGGAVLTPGRCRFVGEVRFSRGTWVGVELDEPEGSHDGCVNGHRYFKCADGHGLFVPVERALRSDDGDAYTAAIAAAAAAAAGKRGSASSSGSAAGNGARQRRAASAMPSTGSASDPALAGRAAFQGSKERRARSQRRARTVTVDSRRGRSGDLRSPTTPVRSPASAGPRRSRSRSRSRGAQRRSVITATTAASRARDRRVASSGELGTAASPAATTPVSATPPSRSRSAGAMNRKHRAAASHANASGSGSGSGGGGESAAARRKQYAEKQRQKRRSMSSQSLARPRTTGDRRGTRAHSERVHSGAVPPLPPFEPLLQAGRGRTVSVVPEGEDEEAEAAAVARAVAAAVASTGSGGRRRPNADKRNGGARGYEFDDEEEEDGDAPVPPPFPESPKRHFGKSKSKSGDAVLGTEHWTSSQSTTITASTATTVSDDDGREEWNAYAQGGNGSATNSHRGSAPTPRRAGDDSSSAPASASASSRAAAAAAGGALRRVSVGPEARRLAMHCADPRTLAAMLRREPSAVVVADAAGNSRLHLLADSREAAGRAVVASAAVLLAPLATEQPVRGAVLPSPGDGVRSPLRQHLNDTNDEGRTAATVAALNGRWSLVELLVAEGADVLHRGPTGSFPALWTLCLGDARGRDHLRAGVAARLRVLEAGPRVLPLPPPVRVKASERQVAANSALQALAVRYGTAANLPLLRLLVEEVGANVNHADASGNTAMHLLASNPRRLGVIRHLVQQGALVDVLNRAGETPLAVAARSRAWPIVQYLAAMGASVDVGAGEGAPPGQSVYELCRLVPAGAAAMAEGLRLRKRHREREHLAEARAEQRARLRAEVAISRRDRRRQRRLERRELLRQIRGMDDWQTISAAPSSSDLSGSGGGDADRSFTAASRSRNLSYASASGPDDHLPLTWVLRVPHYAMVFTGFCEESYCDENIRFLEAVVSYQALWVTAIRSMEEDEERAEEEDVAEEAEESAEAEKDRQWEIDAAAQAGRGDKGGAAGSASKMDRVEALVEEMGDPLLRRQTELAARQAGGEEMARAREARAHAREQRLERRRRAWNERFQYAAESTYLQFIDPAGDQLVNIAGHVRERISAAMRDSTVDVRLFNEAAAEVFCLVQRDVYKRFVQSDLYTEMITSLPPSVAQEEISVEPHMLQVGNLDTLIRRRVRATPGSAPRPGSLAAKAAAANGDAAELSGFHLTPGGPNELLSDNEADSVEAPGYGSDAEGAFIDVPSDEDENGRPVVSVAPPALDELRRGSVLPGVPYSDNGHAAEEDEDKDDDDDDEMREEAEDGGGSDGDSNADDHEAEEEELEQGGGGGGEERQRGNPEVPDRAEDEWDPPSGRRRGDAVVLSESAARTVAAGAAAAGAPRPAVIGTTSLASLRAMHEAGLCLTGRDRFGNTRLHAVAARRVSRRSVGTLAHATEYLLSRGCAALVNSANEAGLTPPMVAASRKRWPVVYRLVAAGGDVVYKGELDSLPSVIELCLRHPRGLRAVRRGIQRHEARRRAGALPPGSPEPMEHTAAVLARAMFRAVKAADAAILLHLLEARGADVNCSDKSGNTALHLVAGLKKSLHLAQLLVQFGANIHRKNEQGDTPVLIAARSRAWVNMRFLVAVGANIAERDWTHGRTVYEYAQLNAVSRQALISALQANRENRVRLQRAARRRQRREEESGLASEDGVVVAGSAAGAGAMPGDGDGLAGIDTPLQTTPRQMTFAKDALVVEDLFESADMEMVRRTSSGSVVVPSRNSTFESVVGVSRQTSAQPEEAGAALGAGGLPEGGGADGAAAAAAEATPRLQRTRTGSRGTSLERLYARHDNNSGLELVQTQTGAYRGECTGLRSGTGRRRKNAAKEVVATVGQFTLAVSYRKGTWFRRKFLTDVYRYEDAMLMPGGLSSDAAAGTVRLVLPRDLRRSHLVSSGQEQQQDAADWPAAGPQDDGTSSVGGGSTSGFSLYDTESGPNTPSSEDVVLTIYAQDPERLEQFIRYAVRMSRSLSHEEIARADSVISIEEE